MGRLGIPELLIILTIIILIFGANRLPEIGRGIGKGLRNFKDSFKEGPEKAERAALTCARGRRPSSSPRARADRAVASDVVPVSAPPCSGSARADAPPLEQLPESRRDPNQPAG